VNVSTEDCRCCLCVDDSRESGRLSVTVGDAASQEPAEGAAAVPALGAAHQKRENFAAQ